MQQTSPLQILSKCSCTLRAVFVATPMLLVAVEAAQTAEEVPSEIARLQLTDIRIHHEPHHRYGRVVEGKLPEGSWIEIDLDRQNEVKEIEAKQRDCFSLDAIAALIPGAVLTNPSLPTHAQLWKVEFDHHDGLDFEGRDATNREFEAKFTADGALLEMKYH